MMNSEPIAVPTKEDEDTSLLSFDTDSSQSTPPKPHPQIWVIFTVLILVTCLVIAFGFLFLSSSSSHHDVSRPFKKLKHPVVLLISSDGFRFGYQYKTDTPNMNRLIKNGTEAELGLIPVFPTLTFPNHYAIVTGLYPEYHGIVNNYFLDPNSPGEAFNMKSYDPKWWLGEPLWETLVNHGLKAATYFWPGSEVNKGGWTCPQFFCKRYNGSVPFEERVDTVLNYFDLPSDEIPSFMTLYFGDPDHQGHKVGPDDPQITEAIERVDGMIGKLIKGLEERGVFEDVNIIMVGDHGMVGTCDNKLIFLEDLAPWIEISKDWIQSYSPLLSIRPPPSYSAKDVVTKMNEGLKSGKVQNGKYLKVYLKEELPDRLHYSASNRIPPIIGLIDEAFKVEQKSSKSKECGGSHGYDNAFFSMRSIFIAHGPKFARGRKVPSFENVQIYNLVTTILNIQGASNNGTTSFPKTILLPSH
ncbi:uncharacterized protein LOC132054622 [Lycium ferocissimum]|uniref:uncharacterized protein LOC132054622 n=1 Tax=Lycium ferocissimum TaxID=112874 RepID=UPI00281631A0|nr:uncharacterized protein LOC132054622 [Lycium ferocissimum]